MKKLLLSLALCLIAVGSVQAHLPYRIQPVQSATDLLGEICDGVFLGSSLAVSGSMILAGLSQDSACLSVVGAIGFIATLRAVNNKLIIEDLREQQRIQNFVNVF